jgi:CrcB protein
MTVALVIVAGSLGAVGRFLVAGFVQRRLATEWPWGTAVVNAIGAFVIGVAVGVDASPTVTRSVAGAVAGFTTFSTWMVEAAALWVEGRGGHVRAVVDVAVPLVAGVGLTVAGLALGRAF